MDRQDEVNGRFSVFTISPEKQDCGAGILVTSHVRGYRTDQQVCEMVF